MDDHIDKRTSVTLLNLVSRTPTDQEAWGTFVARYGPMVESWCRARGLQAADAEDAKQVVLAKLVRLIGQFRYDPGLSFRGWLRVVAENACRDLGRRGRPTTGPGAAALEGVAAREDLATRLEREYDIDLFEMAKSRVRARVAPSTWEAFHLTTIEKLSGPEAAEQLGMQVAAILKAKSNVIKRLREEVRALDQRPTSPPTNGPTDEPR